MTAMTIDRTGAAARPARFTDTLASEWSKIFSVRSTYIMIALTLLLSVGMTALVSLAVGSTFDEWNPADQAQFEPIMFSLVGIIFGGIVLTVFGVLVASGEYASGMIRQTLTATPQRWRVLAAKVLIVVAVTGIVGLATNLAMFFVGQAVLGSYDMPTATLGDADVQRTILGLSALGPFLPVMGLCLAFVLRSTAGAITAVLAIIWLPEIFGALLPMWWRENVLSRLPGPASDSLAIGHLAESPMYSDVPIAAAVTVAWLAVFLGAAYVSLTRRDA